MKFAEYAESWIDREEPYLKASTAQVYRRTIVRLVSNFGGCEIEAIRWPVVRDWIRAQNIRERSASNLLSVFRIVMEGAVEDEIIEDNPLAGRRARLKSRQPSLNHKEPFSAQERAALLAAAVHPGERNMLQFMMWTGLRISETIALDWSDVDDTRVHIRGALTQAAREVERPKTVASTRFVHLLRPAKSALDKQRAQTRLGGGAVFLNPRTGRRWTGDASIRRMFKRVCVAAGVPYRNPYMLRHTYASMMLTAGEDVAWISSQMGHTNPVLTGQVYARYLQNEKGVQEGSKAEGLWPD